MAERRARALALEHAGALAFSRTGNPVTGEFEEAVLLTRFGARFAARVRGVVLVGWRSLIKTIVDFAGSRVQSYLRSFTRAGKLSPPARRFQRIGESSEPVLRNRPV